MKMIVGMKMEEKVFESVTINTVKEIEYQNTCGFTFENHEENETCTGQPEQCLVIWLNNSTERATFPISTIAYVKTK